MKNLKSLVWVLSALFLISACKDDPTNTELLTDHQWKLTSLTVAPPVPFNGSSISDFYSQYEDCDKDDLVIFEAGGQVKFDEGSTKCSNSDDQVISAVWAFDTTESSVSITDAGQTDTWEIKTLNENTLSVTVNLTDVIDLADGISYVGTATYEPN